MSVVDWARSNEGYLGANRFRILDLTADRGHFCGMILAQLGGSSSSFTRIRHNLVLAHGSGDGGNERER